MRHFTKTLIAALAVALALSACTTTEKVDVAEAQVNDIRKGSSTADLIAALGEPRSIEPFEKDPETVEVWTYEIAKSHTDMVAARTQEIPYVDPLTGEMKMIVEPLYSPQTTTKTDTIKVYVANEIILGWTVDRTEDRKIVD